MNELAQSVPSGSDLAGAQRVQYAVYPLVLLPPGDADTEHKSPETEQAGAEASPRKVRQKVEQPVAHPKTDLQSGDVNSVPELHDMRQVRRVMYPASPNNTCRSR